MSMSNTTENDVLKMMLQGTDPSWRAGATQWIALHTADPGEAGSAVTSEATYTSYARVAVTKSSGWTDAGSGSNPWTEVIEAGYTAAEILRILAAHAAGSATGLEGANPQFTGLDGATVRIDGTYSAGTRTIDSLDGA